MALLVVFSALSPGFLTAGNLTILIKHVAINAVLAIGMTFVILRGGIDLSVGSVAGLAGIIAGGLIHHGLLLRSRGVVVSPKAWLVIAVALFAGALVGAINGTLISRLRVAPFVTTLGTLYVARGVALLISDGATVLNLAGRPDLNNPGFLWLGSGAPFGLPVPIWLMLGFTGIGVFLAERTPFGRRVYGVDGNERAAELREFACRKIKFAVYVNSGISAAMVGLVIAAQLAAAHPSTGETFVRNAIAAVVLGGTSQMGGRGSVGGTIIDAFVIGPHLPVVALGRFCQFCSQEENQPSARTQYPRDRSFYISALKAGDCRMQQRRYGRTAMRVLWADHPAIEISARAAGVQRPRLPAPPPRRVPSPEDRGGPGVLLGVPGQSAERAVPQSGLPAAIP